ncbi:MAG: helix-turn-helix transcriptional regulator [Armatimonadota bacterium]
MADHSHSHPHTEIMFVLSGYGQMGYCGEVYPFSAGTVFCFGPNEPHDLEMPEWGHEAQMLWIVLLGRKFIARVTSFRQDLPRGTGVLGHLVMAEDSGLMAANPLRELTEAGARQGDVRTLQLHAGIQLMISALVDDGDDLNPIPEEPVQRRVVRMIREHLEETGGADMSPAELARMSGYSKSHFMAMFKRLTGTTLQEYLDDCRWRKALEMRGQGYARCNIAANLGFSCPASFSRWFRQQREKRGEEEPVTVARRERQERQEANVVRARIID